MTGLYTVSLYQSKIITNKMSQINAKIKLIDIINKIPEELLSDGVIEAINKLVPALCWISSTPQGESRL